MKIPNPEIWKQTFILLLIFAVWYLLCAPFIQQLSPIFLNVFIPIAIAFCFLMAIYYRRCRIDGRISFDKKAENQRIKDELERNNIILEKNTKDLLSKVVELEQVKKAMFNILDDIATEKELYRNQVAETEKYKLAVESASDLIVIMDSESRIIYGNKAVQNMTGFTIEEVIGKKIAELWHDPANNKDYEAIWEKLKTNKKTFSCEMRNRRKDGDNYDAQVAISTVLDEQGNILFFVCIERDITHEKEIDRAKSEFVSLASHQLRTPLSAINWYAEMLLDGDAGPINDDQKSYLQEIHVGNQRMGDLVNSLLNVSRIELGTFAVEPKPTDVKETSESIVKELQPMVQQKHIKLTATYADNLPIYSADPKLLRMIFQNLLSNSVKYTPENGEVKCDVSIKDDCIFIKVSDNGYGITKNQQSKIFTKLFRADNVKVMDTEGTGLGLYILKSIVENTSGKIWFESEENKGTTFFVMLPLSGMKAKSGTKSLD